MGTGDGGEEMLGRVRHGLRWIVRLTPGALPKPHVFKWETYRGGEAQLAQQVLVPVSF